MISDPRTRGELRRKQTLGQYIDILCSRTPGGQSSALLLSGKETTPNLGDFHDFEQLGRRWRPPSNVSPTGLFLLKAFAIVWVL